MPRNEHSHLTHHESVRLDYLKKSIHYLNDRERQELEYLERKAQFGSGSRRTSLSQNRARQHSYGETNGGLPTYPSRRLRSDNQKSKKTRKRARSSRSSQAEAAYLAQTSSSGLPKKMAKKRKKGRVKRFLLVVAVLFLGTLTAMAVMFFKGINDTSNSKAAKSIQTDSEVFHGEDTKDGTNILILGTDERANQAASDARSDSIMVVNVGNKDHKIKVVSFMRDTLVNIPGVSQGYNYDNKLNTAFNIGEQNDNQGAELMRKTLKRNFGIKIKYYAMVDFKEFAEVIDALFPNGVKIDAKFATVNGETVSSVEVPDDLNAKDGVTPTQTIKVGTQYMDGRTLLNYARFRHDDENDYGRTKRQQQVMQAILTQIKSPTKLFTGSSALGTVVALTSTDIPYSFMAGTGLSTVLHHKGIKRLTIPADNDWENEYDMYGGLGIKIDFDKYKAKLKKLGME